MAASVYEPDFCTTRFENVATPSDVVTVDVLPDVKPPGPLPTDTVIEADAEVTLTGVALPSTTSTWTPPIADPAVVAVGVLTNRIRSAPVAATTLNAGLVAGARGVAAAVSVQLETCVAMLRLLNVAIPLAELAVVVPARVAPLQPVSVRATLVAAAPVTVLKLASRRATVTGGAMVWLTTVCVGAWRKPRFVAGPGVTLKVLLVAPVKPVALAVSL